MNPKKHFEYIIFFKKKKKTDPARPGKNVPFFFGGVPHYLNTNLVVVVLSSMGGGPGV